MSNKIIIGDERKGYYISTGYRSASVASSEGRSYTARPGTAFDDIDRKQLINQSRDFMRNNGIYKGMIERMLDYIVGNGFHLQLREASKKAVNTGENLWNNWNKKPEIKNILSGSKMVRMVLRELITVGDTAILKVKEGGGKLQHFEAEQIDGKNKEGFNNGIKTDSFGKPEKFNLCPWKKNSVDIRSGKEVDAANVLFITNPERPSQLRGVPACQAAFPMLHRINDVCDSEAIAWQMLSRLALSVTRENGPMLAHTESKADDTKSSDELEGNIAKRITELACAIIFHGEPGEEVKGIERNIPGMNFSESLRMFLRLMGLPVGLPLELILLDWTKSNYSQSRAILEQAYENFIGWQQLLIDFYYQPLFDWKLEQWKKENLIGKTVDYQISWIVKTFPWIDQLKEAQAYATQVERGFTTHTKVCKSLNSDQAEIVVQRKDEIINAIKLAKEIEKTTGEKVDWKYFAGLKAGNDKSDLAKTEESESDSDNNNPENGDKEDE